jgi:CheY-like chemotaxis protein
MKIEVLCPACGHGYLVDEDAVDPTAQVPCPICGNAMGVPETSALETVSADAVEAVDPVPAPPASVAGAGPAGAAASAAAVQPDPAPLPSAEEVVCPRCSLHFNPQRHRSIETPAGARKTVLVVEDMEYFLEIAKDALSEKFNVKTARTFDGAWAILAAGGIDLLVLDLTLEGTENGKALLEQLRFKPCPILIFTAKDESEMYGTEWQELQSLGADDMVLKGMQVGESLVKKACDLLDVPHDEDGLG